MTPPAKHPPAMHASDGPSHEDLMITLIQGIREAIVQTADRQAAHEAYCLTREDKANALRHDFRAEVAVGHGRLEAKLDKVNDKLDATERALHARISDHKTRAFNWMLGIAGVLILILLGVIGWTVPAAIQAMGSVPLTTVPFGVPPR